MSKIYRKIIERYGPSHRSNVIIRSPVTATFVSESSEIRSTCGFVEAIKTAYGFSIWYDIVVKNAVMHEHVPDIATRQIIEALYGEFRPAIMAIYERLSAYDVEGATTALAHLESLMFTAEIEGYDK